MACILPNQIQLANDHSSKCSYLQTVEKLIVKDVETDKMKQCDIARKCTIH